MEGASPSTDVPPAYSSADIPSRSHCPPPTPLISMLSHLAGCFDDLSGAQQLAAKAALQRCDDDINRLVLNIRDCQMRAVDDIKCIRRDALSHPPPPPSDKGAHTATPPPLSRVAVDSNLHDDTQHPCPASSVANAANVLLNEGCENVVHTSGLTFTQMLSSERFPKSQQGSTIWVFPPFSMSLSFDMFFMGGLIMQMHFWWDYLRNRSVPILLTNLTEMVSAQPAMELVCSSS